MRRTFAISFCLLILLIATGAEAQRRRTRQPVRQRPYISPEKISNDLVGLGVRNVPLYDGRPSDTWTFAADEPKTIRVLQTKPAGDTATLVIDIITNDANTQLAGKLRLNYERVAGDWILTSVDNLTARLRPISPPDYSPPTYGAIERPRQEPPAYERPTSVVLARGGYAIRAGAYQYFPFYVNPSTTGTVSGGFRAAGGGGNDIEVYILDNIQFENFANGHSVSTYYNSGRVTVGEIRTQLGPGNYFLVFSNKFSVFTAKAINADIVLTVR
ncbi:MAG: hypothetical protein JOZ96_23135 [Acidobacteria bacterium]|nr:hypothetical protein [Acidobacteriota bacterium]